MALVQRAIDRAGGIVSFEDVQRAGPVASGATETEQGVRSPGRVARQLQRLFGNRDGGNRIVVALCLDEQTTQAEQPRIGALGHRHECLLRAGAIARQLRGLCVQQQRQRIVLGMALRGFGVTQRQTHMPGADSDQPMGDGVTPARLAAIAATPAQMARQAPQPAHNSPDQHCCDERCAKHQRKQRDRRRDAPAIPHQRDVAVLFGNHGCAKRGKTDQHQKQDRAKHFSGLNPPSTSHSTRSKRTP